MALRPRQARPFSSGKKDAKTDFLAQFFLCFAAVFRRSHVHDSGVQYHPFRIYTAAAAVPFRHTDHGIFFPGNGTGAAMAPPGLNFFPVKTQCRASGNRAERGVFVLPILSWNKAAESSVCDLTDRTGIGRSEKSARANGTSKIPSPLQGSCNKMAL